MYQGIAMLVGGPAVIAVIGWLTYLHLQKYKERRKVSGKNNKLASNLHNEQIKSDFILNAIQDGVVLIDGQKVIRLFNPGAARITGWPSQEAIGLDYRLVIKLVNNKGVAYDAAADPFNMVFKDPKPRRDNNAALLTRSDKRASISLSVSPLLAGDGAVTAAVGVFQDINQERLEEQQRAEFISTASHEMRTPVAAIEGYLALALNDKVSTIDGRARSYLERAHQSTQSLGRLFQDLLTSAKAEDGRLGDHPETVEMSSFLAQVSEDLKFESQKHGLLTDFVIGSGATSDKSTGPGNVVPPLYYVYADPERLREVVTNLFENAVKYTKKGKITIGLTGNDALVQFYIKDTGAGIPTEDISHLFQKFYRVDNSATRTINGTGLGLFICRKIIELYQGQIWVDSELGKGSTFFINLPRLDTQRATELKKDRKRL